MVAGTGGTPLTRRLLDTAQDRGIDALLDLYAYDVRDVARESSVKLDTVTVAHSGRHVYNNMEKILAMNTINPGNNPLQHPACPGKACHRKGMLPRADRLLERAINLSVGVVDRGLGATFGVTIDATDDEVDRQAEALQSAVGQILQRRGFRSVALHELRG